MSTKSSAKRTKSGCWTCRLRRKKCNEGGPPCDNCRSRGVHCHGYGPKPDWKDRGALEREEARKLQYQSSRARSLYASVTSSLPPSSPRRGSVPLTTGDFSPDNSTLVTATDFLMDSPLSPFMSDFETSALGTYDFSVGLELCDAPPDSPTGLGSSNLTRSTASLDWSQFQLTSPELPGLTTAIASSPNTDMEVSPTSLHLGPAHQGLLQSDTTTGEQEHGQRLAEGEKGIGLMMHYLRDMCFGRRKGLNRISEMGWLLLLLTRSSAFYYAALSLSSYNAYLGRSGNSDSSADAFQDYQKYRSRALERLRGLSSCAYPKGQDPSSRFIFCERFICSVQLAHLEATSGNIQDCQTHIDGAAKLLIDHENVLVSGRKQFSAMECEALTFFTVRLIWNDVLIASTKRLVPKAEKVYRKLLDDKTLAKSFEEVTSCEIWVMLAMMDCTILGSWRQAQERSGSLSMRALVGRAEKIEAWVEKHLQRLSDSLQSRIDPTILLSNDSGLTTTSESDETTITSLIFAHAILTDLHQIVSGPRASVPEISDSINRSISTAWRLRPDPTRLDGVLAWPYCVHASLTKDEQRCVFRDMTEGSDAEGSSQSKVQQLRSIIDQCWASAPSTCIDWKDVVQRSNQLGVFLI